MLNLCLSYNKLHNCIVHPVSNYYFQFPFKTHAQALKISLLKTGSVTDGEFSSLRTQGETRPLHLWQLIQDAKESLSQQSQQTLLRMLIKLGGKGIFVVYLLRDSFSVNTVLKLSSMK